MEWMRVKPVRLRDEDGKFVKQKPYVSKRTGERIDPREGPAFAIARAIKRRGLPGVKYWTESVGDDGSEGTGNALWRRRR